MTLPTQKTLAFAGPPLSGPDGLTAILNMLKSMVSNRAGTSRPSDIQDNELWCDTTTATAQSLKIYDGVQDITLGTFNSTTHTWSVAGALLLSLFTAENDFIIASGAGTATKKTLAQIKTLLAGTSAGDLMVYDATLAAIAAITTAANKLIYATGSDTFSTCNLTAFARTLLDDADAAAARTTLGITEGGMWSPVGSPSVANNSATVDFTSLDPTTYDYLVKITGLRPDTNAVVLQLKGGYGAGPSWLAVQQGYAVMMVDQAGTATYLVGSNAAYIGIIDAVSNSSACRTMAEVEVTGHGGLIFSTVDFKASSFIAGAGTVGKTSKGGGVFYELAMTGLRFLMSSGNITAGTFQLYRRTR